MRRGGHRRDRQPAARRRAARDPRRHGAVGRRRAADAVVLDAERPGHARRGRGLAGHRARAAARDHPGRRRRLRREDRCRPGVRARGVAREADGTRGALEREPLGEHDRDAAGPRPAADGDDRWHPRRAGARLPPRRPRRRGRLSPARRVPALLHPLDGARGVRHPAGRVARPRRRDDHDLDRGLPRRGPARGDRGDRAGDGPVRHRDRADPAEVRKRNLIPPDAFPFSDQGRGDLRQRRVRQGPRPGARRRGLRGAARRAGRAPRARRRRPARHRPRHVRRDHRRRRVRRGRLGRGAPGRHGHRAHRHLAARAGPRDGLGDARERAPRRSRSR